MFIWIPGRKGHVCMLLFFKKFKSTSRAYIVNVNENIRNAEAYVKEDTHQIKNSKRERSTQEILKKNERKTEAIFQIFDVNSILLKRTII